MKTKKPHKTDRHTVSNEWHELKRWAKIFGCMPSDVLRAKEQTSSRSRVRIEDWIKHNVVKPETPAPEPEG